MGLVFRVKYVVISVQCAVCCLQCAVCFVLCAVCSVLCAVCSVQGVICSLSRAVYWVIIDLPAFSIWQGVNPYSVCGHLAFNPYYVRL